MLLLDGPLTFGEFMSGEDLPLAVVFREVLDFLKRRPDVALFGAHAVNAYCEPERMTQDIDVMGLDAPALSEELRAHLAERFHIAVRVREVVAGQGFRVYQLRKPSNRHLVDVRQVRALPACREIAGVMVTAPADLIALKVISHAARREQPKGTTDLADLQRLLLAFPELKVAEGEVRECLAGYAATRAALTRWQELVETVLVADDDQGW